MIEESLWNGPKTPSAGKAAVIWTCERSRGETQKKEADEKHRATNVGDVA
jgi:hypothetical protein